MFENQKFPIKWVVTGVVSVLAIIMFLFVNPFAWNDAGERTVVQQMSGKQFVQFESGVYYAGLFAKKTSWPNQISVSYSKQEANLELEDNGIEIGKIGVRFGGDATTADVSGIAQYILPNDEKDMILIHNTHRTPQSLVTKRLSPYTKECLQSAAQLMSSEMHYSGGRAQMSQDYIDQLKSGTFILQTKEYVEYDSLEKAKKRIYQTVVQTDKNGQVKRKVSSIKEYGITVADASITDVDYEKRVDDMLAKKIDASTAASVSKQRLMTAQQQALTAEAEGKKKLVEIEYTQKQEQTKQVVAAQTKVELAKQDLEQQRIAKMAATEEASKVKILADAEAYKKRAVIQANGALEQKLDAWVKVNKEYAAAMSNSNWVPTTVMGGNGSSHNTEAASLIQLMMAKTAKEINLDMKTSK
jgi:hypothetical protein